MKKVLLAASAASLLLLSQANAGNDGLSKIYTECGLGGIIGKAFEDETTSKVMAVITNITWDLGTTASLSYSLSPDTCANKRGRVASFINNSYEKLEEDIANGEGKYLDTLAQMVTESKDQKVLAAYKQQLRAAFAQSVASQDYSKLSRYQKVEKLFNIAL